MSYGTYEEMLPCGGTLKVRRAFWEIAYYFYGPDRRYNGTFVSVPGESVPDYITAFRENWAEYEQLRNVIPGGGDFSKPARQGMSIRINGFNPGVCIRGYHMPITTLEHLEKVIKSYDYASKRAPQIQAVLESLPVLEELRDPSCAEASTLTE
jgi:hypothetical protein